MQKGVRVVEIVIKANFWFDGIDDATEDEIKKYVEAMLESGAEATSCDVTHVGIEIE